MGTDLLSTVTNTIKDNLDTLKKVRDEAQTKMKNVWEEMDEEMNSKISEVSKNLFGENPTQKVSNIADQDSLEPQSDSGLLGSVNKIVV